VASLLSLICFSCVVVAERFARRYFITRLCGATHTGAGDAIRMAVHRVRPVALGFFVSLQMVGANLTSLSFLAGAVDIGFGFGCRTLSVNFISGLIILAERPIAVGDRVEIGGGRQVREISLRSTTVVTNGQHGHHRANADFPSRSG